MFDSILCICVGHLAEGNYNFTSLEPRCEEEPLHEIHDAEDDAHVEEDVDNDAQAEENEGREEEEPPLAAIGDTAPVESSGQRRSAASRRKPQKEEPRPKKSARIESMMGQFLELKTKQAENDEARLRREEEAREKEVGKGDDYSIKKCISVINTMQVTKEEKAKAIAVFTKSKENREAFICTCEADQECALIWLRNEMA
jgi:hypothetical protein